MACQYVEFHLTCYRLRAGLTQSQLADAVGVSKNTISSIECHQFMPSLTLAYKLAQYFGVRIEDLFVPYVGGVE